MGNQHNSFPGELTVATNGYANTNSDCKVCDVISHNHLMETIQQTI